MDTRAVGEMLIVVGYGIIVGCGMILLDYYLIPGGLY
jgi:hypothetical protein